MSAKAYVSRATPSERWSDSMQSKMTRDLRNHIRQLAIHPVFSAPWIKMTGSLQYIASMSVMEKRVMESEEAKADQAAANANKESLLGLNRSASESSNGSQPSQALKSGTPGSASGTWPSGDKDKAAAVLGTSRVGNQSPSTNFSLHREGLRDGKGEATLWDRDDAMVARLLLEEGKVNVLIRNVRDFKAVQRSLTRNPENITAVAKQLAVNVSQVKYWVTIFERYAGQILEMALSATESMQTVDMDELISHCAEVLSEAYHFPWNMKNAAKESLWELGNSQEVLVLLYLNSIAQTLDDLNDERVLAWMEENMVFPMVVIHLYRHHKLLNKRTLKAACEYMSAVCDSETFQTHKSKYLRNAQEEEMLLGLGPIFLDKLLAGEPTWRKHIANLLTTMRRLKKPGVLGLTNSEQSKPSTSPTTVPPGGS